MSKQERTWVVVGVAWSLLHLIFLSMGSDSGNAKRYFVPIQENKMVVHMDTGGLYYYDYSEFLVYVGVFWLVFLGYRFINKAK